MAGDECSHSCGGICCRAFTINHSPERIGELYLAAVARIVAFEDTADDWDKVFTAEMLIRIDESDETGPMYTCTHFLANLGLCGAYAQRPNMCRTYPGGRSCVYCGFSNAPAETSPALVTLTERPKHAEAA